MPENGFIEKAGKRYAVVCATRHKGRFDAILRVLAHHGVEAWPLVREGRRDAQVLVRPEDRGAALRLISRWTRRDERFARLDGRRFVTAVWMLLGAIVLAELTSVVLNPHAGLVAFLTILGLAWHVQRGRWTEAAERRRAIARGAFWRGAVTHQPPIHPDGIAVVYKALYGPNTEKTLHVLRDADCSPVMLDEPYAVPPLPAVAPGYQIRIAVPVGEVDAARAALLSWADENEARQAAFRREMRAWMVRAVLVLLVAFLLPGGGVALLMGGSVSGTLAFIAILMVTVWQVVLLVALSAIQRGATHATRRRTWFVALAGLFTLTFGALMAKGDIALRPAPSDQLLPGDQ